MMHNIFAVPAAGGFDINLLLTLVGGASGAAAAWKILGLLLDRLLPTKGDRRSDIESTFSVLSDTLALLRADKATDQTFLIAKQARITELESEADRDYSTLKALREERDELTARLKLKDATIAELAAKITILGATVIFGLDGAVQVKMPMDLEEHFNTT